MTSNVSPRPVPTKINAAGRETHGPSKAAMVNPMAPHRRLRGEAAGSKHDVTESNTNPARRRSHEYARTSQEWTRAWYENAQRPAAHTQTGEVTRHRANQTSTNRAMRLVVKAGS